MRSVEKNTVLKKLTLIIPKGRHSNRLIQNMNFEAFCMEYGIEYNNPTFTDIDFYAYPCSTKTSIFIKFLRINFLTLLFRNSSFVKKYFSVAWLLSRLGIIKYVVFNKSDVKKGGDCEKILLEAFEKNNIVYTGGWSFRVPKLVEKHRDEIIRKYSLKPKFYENNDFYKKITKLKQERNTLIGVHIRRGDYKKWQGGKYYFDDEVYENCMKGFNAENQFFIIFSNDKVKFSESKNLLVSKENWYIDHHIMSLCDYIIGPPSTFSLWAAYIGKNKIYHIFDGNKAVKPQDFIEYKDWEL